MLFPLPGDPAKVAAENTPPGMGIGNRHCLPALAAPEGTADLLQMGIPGVLPVKPFTVGGTEFLPPVIQTGHLHKLSAAGAGKAPQHRPVLIFRVELRLLPIGQAAARIGAEAPVLVLGRKGFPAHFTVFYYFHRLRSSPSGRNRHAKKAAVKAVFVYDYQSKRIPDDILFLFPQI